MTLPELRQGWLDARNALELAVRGDASDSEIARLNRLLVWARIEYRTARDKANALRRKHVRKLCAMREGNHAAA